MVEHVSFHLRMLSYDRLPIESEYNSLEAAVFQSRIINSIQKDFGAVASDKGDQMYDKTGKESKSRCILL